MGKLSLYHLDNTREQWPEEKPAREIDSIEASVQVASMLVSSELLRNMQAYSSPDLELDIGMQLPMMGRHRLQQDI